MLVTLQDTFTFRQTCFQNHILEKHQQDLGGEIKFPNKFPLSILFLSTNKYDPND